MNAIARPFSPFPYFAGTRVPGPFVSIRVFDPCNKPGKLPVGPWSFGPFELQFWEQICGNRCFFATQIYMFQGLTHTHTHTTNQSFGFSWSMLSLFKPATATAWKILSKLFDFFLFRELIRIIRWYPELRPAGSKIYIVTYGHLNILTVWPWEVQSGPQFQSIPWTMLCWGIDLGGQWIVWGPKGPRHSFEHVDAQASVKVLNDWIRSYLGTAKNGVVSICHCESLFQEARLLLTCSDHFELH